MEVIKMMKARRLILGGVFTTDNFILAIEAVKIMQNGKSPPRTKDGDSALQEIVFNKKDDGTEVKFMCGFIKDDAIVYFENEWMAGNEYGHNEQNE